MSLIFFETNQHRNSPKPVPNLLNYNINYIFIAESDQSQPLSVIEAEKHLFASLPLNGPSVRPWLLNYYQYFMWFLNPSDGAGRSCVKGLGVRQKLCE